MQLRERESRLASTTCSGTCGRHVTRISSRREPTCRGPKVPPAKKREILGFGSLFLGGSGQFICLRIFAIFLFYFSAHGGHGPLGLPLATSLTCSLNDSALPCSCTEMEKKIETSPLPRAVQNRFEAVERSNNGFG